MGTLYQLQQVKFMIQSNCFCLNLFHENSYADIPKWFCWAIPIPDGSFVLMYLSVGL